MANKNDEFEGKNAEEVYIADENQANTSENDIRVTDESVAIIASTAALEVQSVSRMSSGIAGGIVEAIVGKNPAKGVKVFTDADGVALDLYVVVNYGQRISDIAWEIQEHVKEAVEKMTGVHVNAVNIHIQGIDFGKEEK